MTHTLFSPLDMHLHLRDEAMLKVVAPLSAHSFAGGIIMPNLVWLVSLAYLGIKIARGVCMFVLLI